MDKGQKRRRSTTSHLRSKYIVSFFADLPTMDRTGKHPAEQLNHLEFSTIYIANIDDDRFRTPPVLLKMFVIFFSHRFLLFYQI